MLVDFFNVVIRKKWLRTRMKNFPPTKLSDYILAI